MKKLNQYCLQVSIKQNLNQKKSDIAYNNININQYPVFTYLCFALN